jgi:hypothetical protein
VLYCRVVAPKQSGLEPILHPGATFTIPPPRPLAWVIASPARFFLLIGLGREQKSGRMNSVQLVNMSLYSRDEPDATQGLRPYVVVQFLPMLVLPVLLLGYPSAVAGSGYIWVALAAYTVSSWNDKMPPCCTSSGSSAGTP